jgi:glycosyltransferase involved in cell wall biosynthesis
MGKPVIAPTTQGIKDYFDKESLHYFTPGDANSLAHEILNEYSNPAVSAKIVHRGAAVYRQHRWELQRKNLVHLVSDVLQEQP